MGRWLNLARELTYPHDNSDRSDKSPPQAVVEEPIVPIVTIVAPSDDNYTPFDTGDYEERAAIIQFGAGVPRDWAEGFARLCTMPRHPDFNEEQWNQLIDDTGRFLDRWAVQVAAMGWTTQEVFGVHPGKPDARIDLKGLVPCIGGKEVIAVSADSATIQTPSGAHQRIFRRADIQSPGRVPVWEIDQQAKL